MKSRNLIVLKDVNGHIVSGPQKFSWVREDALKSQLFKVFWQRSFLAFLGDSKTKRTVGKKFEHSRNLILLKDVNQDISQSPELIFLSTGGCLE